MSQYTDETRKAAADRVAAGESPTAIARDIGVTPRTINNWAKKYGVTSQERTKKAAEAREVLAAKQDAKREQLKNLLLDKALMLTEAIAPGKGVRDNATALGILIDKYRLEMGESTSRSELVGDVDRELGVRLKEWERQLAAND